MAKTKKKEGFLIRLEAMLESFFVGKLPGLPVKVKEIIVKIIPWLTLLVFILTVKMILTAWGVWGVMMMGYGSYSVRYSYGLASILSLVAMVLVLLALPGLFKMKKGSWKLMFYSGLLMAVEYLISLDLGSLLFGSGISMYILFQVKSLYK